MRMLRNSLMQPCMCNTEFEEHSWESLKKQTTVAVSLCLHYIKDFFFFSSGIPTEICEF